jgi:peptidoglycan/LPS O-acetylase OafA/YrhL
VRNSALDGLRGIAIVLVVLNHAGQSLWFSSAVSDAGPYGVPFLRGLFGGGAVVVFFVVGAFIVTVGLQREMQGDRLDPARFLLRRLVRLGVQLLLLSLALVAVQAWDPTAPGTMLNLVNNLGHMLTYTLNLLPLQADDAARGEVFHLWYLSVQQQCYLVLPLFLLAFARRPRVAVAVLAVLIGAVYLHRQQVTDQDWVLASILTTTRSDGLLWGVLLALVLPWLGRWRTWSWVLLLSAVGMLGCQLVLQELGTFAYLGPWSLVYQFFIGVALVSIWLQREPSVVSRVFSTAPLTWLGRNSLTIYFWHLPVFSFVGRHLADQPWWVLGGVSAVAVGLVTVVLERAVEQPTRRLLAQHPLFRSQATRPAGGQG